MEIMEKNIIVLIVEKDVLNVKEKISVILKEMECIGVRGNLYSEHPRRLSNT